MGDESPNARGNWWITQNSVYFHIGDHADYLLILEYSNQITRVVMKPNDPIFPLPRVVLVSVSVLQDSIITTNLESPYYFSTFDNARCKPIITG